MLGSTREVRQRWEALTKPETRTSSPVKAKTKLENGVRRGSGCLRFQAIAETLGFSREGEAFLMLVRASVKSSGRGAR